MNQKAWLLLVTVMAVAWGSISAAFAVENTNKTPFEELQSVIERPELNYIPCRSGSLSRCGGGGDPDPDPDRDPDDNDNDDGPSPAEEDGDAIKDEASEASQEAIDKANEAAEEAAESDQQNQQQVNDTLDTNTEQQQTDAENAQPGDTTDCPIELATGCKVTKAEDWSHPLLPVKRVHRISQGSAWSLGTGWHTSLDSRIILGVDKDISAQIQSSIAVVNKYSALIADLDAAIDQIENGFKGRIGYHRANAQAAIKDAIAQLQAKKASYVPARDAAVARTSALQQRQHASQTRRSSNRDVVDINFPAEFEIGRDIVKWVMPSGGRLLFNDLGNGQYSATPGHNNRLTRLNNNQWQVDTPQGKTFLYTSQGLLQSVSDREGRKVTVTYSSANKPNRITDELGRSVSLTYSGERLSQLTDAIGRTARYQYRDGKLSQVNAFDGQSDRYQYQYTKEPLAITAKSDGKNNTWRYEYQQQQGKAVVVKQTDAKGKTFRYQYKPDEASTIVTDRNGVATTYRYDDNQRIVSVQYTDGSEVTNVYDSKGNRLVRQNELGDIIRYRYNDNGEVISVTDGAGTETRYTRNNKGQLLSQTNGRGDATTFTYDSKGRVDQIELADGSVINEQWTRGLLTRRVDEAGNITDYQYDALGYPIQLTRYQQNMGELDYAKSVELRAYDAIGRVLWVKQGGEDIQEDDWRETRYYYTAASGSGSAAAATKGSRKPIRIVDPLGREARFDYDRNSNLIRHQDFSGVITHYQYTATNKVASKQIVMPVAELGDVIDSNSDDGESVIETQTQSYTYQYDAEDNLIQATQPGGVVWKYQYDKRNRLVRSEIVGTNTKRSYTYDDAGQKLTETDSNGHSVQYRYNGDGQQQSIVTPLGNIISYGYNSAGQRVETFDETRRGSIQYSRNELGHITEVSDPNDNIITYMPNSLGQTLAISQPNSSEARLTHTLNWRGQPLQTTTALGKKTVYQYNVFGENIAQANREGTTHIRQYDAIGRLTEERTRGLHTTWQYQQSARKLEVIQTQTDSLNMSLLGSKRESRKTYDLLGRLIRYQDSLKQQWTFTYNPQGWLASTTNPDGSTISRTYNKAGQVETIRHDSGNESGETRITTYQYDGEGNRLSEQLPHYDSQTRNEYRYNSLGQQTSVITPDHNETQYRYDAAGRRTGVIYPNQTSEQWDYDANDNPITYTDQDDYQWQYGYNANNQLTSLCDPVSGAAGCSDTNRYKYDAMGNLIASITPQGNTTTFKRNRLGHVSQKIDANNAATQYGLDRYGRVLSITDPLGNTTTQSYTAFNQINAVTDAIGNTTKFYYDQQGRLIERKNRLDASQQWAYNYRNQITQTTDALDNQTQYQYNPFGNLTQVNQAQGIETQYQWNKADKLTKVIDPMGGEQTYEYNEVNQLTSYTNQIDKRWQYDYNDMGQVSTLYQPQTETNIDYQYDGRGNKVLERYIDPQTEMSEQNQWQYDGAGRLAAIGNRYLVEQYTYDASGRLTQQKNENLKQSFDYRYDSKGQRVQNQLNDTDKVQYKRNANGQITQIQRINADETLTFTLQYNKLGQVSQIDYPNQSRRTLQYDAEGRIIAIKIEQRWYTHRWENQWNTVELFEYRYDAAGNLIAENRKTKEAYYDQWAYFEYDSLNRLIEADYPYHYDNYYQWDDNGNLINKKAKGLEYKYEYNRANQLTGYRGNYYLWYDVTNDDNGNPIKEQSGGYTFDYQYNPLGQLTQFNRWDNTEIKYGYDSRARRVYTKRAMTHSKNWGKSEQHTAYDGRQEFGQWIKDPDNKNDRYKPFRSLTLLPKDGQPYSSVLHQKLNDKQHRLVSAVGTMAADIENLYIHSDRLDSSVHVLDKTGRMAMRLGYSPMGRTYRKYDDVMTYYYDLEPLANYEFAQLMPYRFTGKFTDFNTGLTQMDARWYNPHTARFLQPDYWNLRNTHLPAEIQHELMQFAGLNTQQLLRDPAQQMAYGYVRGNPLSYVDPMGLNAMYVPDNYYSDVVVKDNAIDHYSRNDENDKFIKDNNLYGRDDIRKEELESAGEHGMKKAEADESIFHQQGVGNEANEKYTSKVADEENYIQGNVTNRYGRYEVVVRPNEDGTYTHVNDDINMGTLNRGNNIVSHVIKDIAPYAEHGNRESCD